jgi:hypothetical protein
MCDVLLSGLCAVTKVLAVRVGMLVKFARKCHMRLLYPSPADFTAFLGRH